MTTRSNGITSHRGSRYRTPSPNPSSAACAMSCSMRRCSIRYRTPAICRAGTHDTLAGSIHSSRRASHRRACAAGQASKLSAQRVLQHLFIQAQISHHLTQLMAVVGGRLFGVPYAFYYALAAAIIMWYVFDYIPLGRRLLFVGRGREVARLNGISVDRVRLGALITSGVLSALAGILYAGVLGSADP